jgi:hypothetical protein
MTVHAGRIRNAGLVLHSRLCAIITALSCVAHLALVAENHHGPWLSLLMLALASVCIPCTVHIWRQGRVAALRRVMGSALLMVAVHGLLLLGAKGSGHQHSAGVLAVPDSAGAAVPDLSGTAGMLGIVGLEIMTALLAATLVARLRRSPALQPAMAR